MGMKEKLMSLPLTELRQIAKGRGMKRVTGLRKDDLIQKMLEMEGQEETKEDPKAAKGPEKAADSPEHTEPQEPPQTETVSQITDPVIQPAMADIPPSPAVYTEFQGTLPSNTQEKVSESPREREAARPVRETRRVIPSDGEPQRYARGTRNEGDIVHNRPRMDMDSGKTVSGILEVMPDGFGFIRSANFLPGEDDVYVAPSQIRRFGLRTGDIVCGNTRVQQSTEKFSALLYLKTVNGMSLESLGHRMQFEKMTPVFPQDNLRLSQGTSNVAMRIVDLVSPVGKGQRGMIVSPPKAGKTTLLKQIAKSVVANHPDMHLIILLIDERPEEVTDIKESIQGEQVEVIYSTFDELPERHKRVSEMVLERAKRLVESHKDVVILLDSITRLARAYNLTIPSSGRTLSGGLDPAALHMPKRFFGAARNMREGGSLTILATALVDTGSKMDDVVYEEFKGTGNMELVLDRKLSERRIFPAVDIVKSGTRREDLLLNKEEMLAVYNMRRGFNSGKADEAVERTLDMFARTRSNQDFVQIMRKTKLY